jgi:hypothetical protein
MSEAKCERGEGSVTAGVPPHPVSRCARNHPLPQGERGQRVRDSYSAACAAASCRSAASCGTVGTVPATVARRMSRGCDWS